MIALAAFLPVLWGSTQMVDEPLFFVKEHEAQNPCAHLLFAPTSPLTIRDSTGKKLFEPGKDYSFAQGDRRVCLSADSSIPYKNRAELYPPRKAPGSIDKHKSGTTNLLFSEKDRLAELQVSASYQHKANEEGRPSPPTGLLNLAAFKGKDPVKFSFLGDSICRGMGSTHGGFAERFVAELERRFHKKITFENFSFPGDTSESAKHWRERANAAKPHLVIIAYGANDSGSPAAYGANIRQTIQAMRAQNPAAEFILVSPLLVNPEWHHANEPLQAQYRAELRQLQGPGVIFADVGSVWKWATEKKKFLDLTSNGVNHPNDFGHRLYVEVLLETLSAKPPGGK